MFSGRNTNFKFLNFKCFIEEEVVMENKMTFFTPSIEVNLNDMDPKIARLMKAYDEFKNALYAVQVANYDFLKVSIKK